jgi:high frequency lysogenization protein
VLVDQLASTGKCDNLNNEASLNSIVTNSTNIEEVYKSTDDLSTGLNALKVAFDNKSKSMQKIIFYSLALIKLEKKLMKNQQLLNKISNEIEIIKGQDFFEISHSNSIARLAQLYKSTLGSLNPRIMVTGEQIYLTNQHTANHIRALLLAGIRAVSLWKSQGGRTWQLLFNKKKTLKLVNSMDF